MLGAEDFVFEIDDLLVFAGGFGVFALAIEGKGDVVPGAESIGVLGAENFLADLVDAAVFGLGFGGFAAIIEGNGEAVPGDEGVGMHRAEEALFQRDDGAEAGDGVVILTLAILRVSEPGAGAEGIGVLGAEGAFPGFGCGAQDFLGLAIRALLDRNIADGVLDIGPLGGVRLAIGELFRGAEIFHCGLELDAFLGCEPGELISLDEIVQLRSRAGLLGFVDGLQGKALGFEEVVAKVGSIRLLVGSSVGCALDADRYIGELRLEHLGIDSYFLAQGLVDLLLDGGRVILGLGLAHLSFDARILNETFAELRHFLAHGHDGDLGFSDALGGFALAVKQPKAEADADDEKDGDGGGPLFYAAPEPGQVAAQFQDAGFECFPAGQRMIEMRVRLQPGAIGGLERAQFLGLVAARVDRESFVDEEIPDLFASRAGVEGFVLGVADAAELRVGLGRLGAVAVADDLEHAFALVDLLAQHFAQVAGLGAEDILPDWLVTEEGEGIGGKLPAAAEFAANGGDEDQRERGHEV